MTTSRSVQQKRHVNLRSIVLPAEHGGWGFLLEPIVLGLLLAPSLRGAALGLAMLALFLLHQPLKIALKSYRQSKRTQRTTWAERFVLLYGLSALVSLGLALYGAANIALLPLLVMAPLFLVQLALDINNESRSLWAELAGATALGGIATAIALLGGWDLLPALSLWALLAARTMPSILFVRAKLRGQRGNAVDPRVLIMAHGLASAAVLLLALGQLLPWLSVVGIVILDARAYVGLRSTAPLKASTVGLREMLFGGLLVLLTVGGVWLGL